MHLLPVLVSCIYITSVFGATYVGPRGGYAVFPVERDQTTESTTTSRTTSRPSTPTPNIDNRNTGTRNEVRMKIGDQQQQTESTNRNNINREGFNNDKTIKSEDYSNPIFGDGDGFADDGEIHTYDGEHNFPGYSPYYVRRYPSWGNIYRI